MAPKIFPPQTMKAWQHTTTTGGLDKNLKLNPSAPLPISKSSQHLVQIIATALNPVDYKPAESALMRRLLYAKVATPGLDYAGCIVTPATGSSLKPGQLVYGITAKVPWTGGALAEFSLAESGTTLPLPEGVSPVDAASIGVAGITAYQSIVPHVKKGDSIFINGGSGGCGVFGIQIAKAAGCYVATSCSTPNVELCQSLGADEVVDYKKGSVVKALNASGVKFDHVVDNVGTTMELYWHCHEFTKPEAQYVMVGGGPGVGSATERFKAKRLPSFLGGGKRAYSGFWPEAKLDDLKPIGLWIKEGKVKAVIDEKFVFEEAPKAFAKLKTGRARGKIVVDIASETYKAAWTE
ncbi:putative zinc-type alcohol dehydrogenase-like protein C16A3.02c [Hyaloscypha variabilis]